MSYGHRYTALVCGGRDYCDQQKVSMVLSLLGIRRLIHGKARGADSCASTWAYFWGIPQDEYPARWDLHGKAAGHLRNTQMLEDGKPDIVVAFPGGRGTANMVQQARAAGVPVIEVL